MLRMSPLSHEDRFTLLSLARESISQAILEKKFPDVPSLQGPLAEPTGAFVTLHRGGKLRGCVGMMDDPPALGETVMRAAVSAALYDSRFPHVSAVEIPQLEIEISVLSKPEQIGIEAIHVGRHGLMIRSEDRRGVLLPQVAAERNWTALRFLEETCEKAGMTRDAWKNPSTKVLAFTAEIFSDESSPCP